MGSASACEEAHKTKRREMLMKYLILFLFAFVANAHADPFKLNAICAKDPKVKLKFASQLRDQIADKIKNLDPDSVDAIVFRKSDAFMWMKLTFPYSLPDFYNRAEAEECANYQQEFLKETDKILAAEKYEYWRACLGASYKLGLPKMASDLLKCFE